MTNNPRVSKYPLPFLDSLERESVFIINFTYSHDSILIDTDVMDNCNVGVSPQFHSPTLKNHFPLQYNTEQNEK